jgi:uncharacterized protein with HEPN domain
MIHAAERARQLTNGLTLDDLQADQVRSESLLWNFTVLGESSRATPGRRHIPVPQRLLAAR